MNSKAIKMAGALSLLVGMLCGCSSNGIPTFDTHLTPSTKGIPTYDLLPSLSNSPQHPADPPITSQH